MLELMQVALHERNMYVLLRCIWVSGISIYTGVKLLSLPRISDLHMIACGQQLFLGELLVVVGNAACSYHHQLTLSS
jgi:hypothetical protein